MDLEKLPAPEIPPVQALVAWLRDGADRETLIGLLAQRACVDEPLRRAIAVRMRATRSSRICVARSRRSWS